MTEHRIPESPGFTGAFGELELWRIRVPKFDGLSRTDWQTLLQFVAAKLSEIAQFDIEDPEFVAVSAVVEKIERQLDLEGDTLP